MRSYDEYCALAKSLDVVGDRWTLLIVRELTLRGACRYTDLRSGLPGIATNLLAERIRELERAGVVAREDAPPPIATHPVHAHSPRRAVATGARGPDALGDPPDDRGEAINDAIRSHWLAWALELMLTDRQPDAPPVTVELQTGDQPIVLETRDGAVHARLGTADDADAALTGEPRPVMGLLLGLLDLRGARATGVKFRGERAILDRIGADTSA